MKRIPGKDIMINFIKKIKDANSNSTRYHELHVDTPVLFTVTGIGYQIGYFAGFDDNGDPMVFCNGKTSITAEDHGCIALNGDNNALMLITDIYL